MISNTKPLKIAMIGVADLEDKVDYRYDPMLYHAFMLMSSNLANATYEADTLGFDNTTPLEFSFTDRELIFCKHSMAPNIATLIREHLLPSSDGVIVNISSSMQKNSRDPLAQLLGEIIQNVHEAGKPTIFATNVVSLEGDWPPNNSKAVFQPDDGVVQFVTETFAESASIIGYDYISPGSIQNILTTLIAEIEKD